MAQDFQGIGQASPEVDQIAAEKHGWVDGPEQPLVDQVTDPHFSFWNSRANDQELGRSIPNMAGHVEPPMAAQPVQPFNPYQEDR